MERKGKMYRYISYDNGKVERVSFKKYTEYMQSHTKGLLNYICFMAEDDFHAMDIAWEYWGWDKEIEKMVEEDMNSDWYKEIWEE